MGLRAKGELEGMSMVKFLPEVLFLLFIRSLATEHRLRVLWGLAKMSKSKALILRFSGSVTW